MDPFTAALAGAGISAAGSAIGGIFGRGKESRMDKKKRELIDDLLASVKGNGPFSDMFNTSEEAFQKSYVDPAKSMFRNQIAPQIQQSYIASGQQRGTGLDDTLSRAGVELDQLLNQQYLNYMNQGNANKGDAIRAILGQANGTQDQSAGGGAGQGFAGYLAKDQFPKDISSILQSYQGKQKNNLQDTFVQPRSGFVNDQV